MNKFIGIKLADGVFYPILEEGKSAKISMDLTTVKDNQQSVHIDLYRSEDNSIENAEYVDTLQIENLLPHPNGEPNLDLEIALDDENVLRAKVTDSESGKASDVTVSLVSRSETDRIADSTLQFADTDLDSASFDEILDESIVDSVLTDDTAFEDDTDDTLDLDNLVFDVGETQTAPVDDLNFDDIDISSDDLFSDNAADDFTDASIDVQDDSKIALVETSEDESELSNDFFDNALNDFLDDSLVDKHGQNAADIEPHMENYKETQTDDTAFSIDFDDLPPPEESQDENFMVNFDDDSSTSTETEATSSESFDSSDDNLNFSDDDFDFDSVTTDTQTSSTTEFASSEQDALFSDLYDNDDITENTTENYTEEKKKTRSGLPVIICLICAIICLIVLLLFLFVIPSRINIRIGDNAETTNEEIIPQENPPAPEADQIIFTDKPITIVPVPAPETEKPAPVNPPQPVDSSSQLVRYNIKWGDTLWDIAWAYYRNPWRYTVIAQYNGIKNPDRIIAGTYILIPPR